MKKWLRECGVNLFKVGSSYVLDGARDAFDEWMYVQFEMTCIGSFFLSSGKCLVYSYHRTDEIIIARECVHDARFAIVTASESVMNELNELC